MNSSMTSRQRMLAALDHQPPDHIPCAFMSFTALRKRVNEDFYALCQAELELGLDSFLFVPSLSRPQRSEHPELRGLPVRFAPEVRTVERAEMAAGEKVLHKEYHTPGGTLTTRVKTSDDWPHGDHIPFIDDYQVPRALKPLVTERKDLEALQYLLVPPTPEDIEVYHLEIERARRFCDEHGVLLVGGWGVGMDMANWFCGVENLMALCIQDEPLAIDLLELIHRWNLSRMQVVLSAPIDLYIKRAWYEGCDFITPRFFRKAVLPPLQEETALAHERGARFGYILSSGLAPVLEDLRQSGIDALIGIDPVQGTHTDLKQIKHVLGERVCLWGGVSGAVTVELGTQDEIRRAVREAVAALGPDGFILSPVDNITVDAPQTWSNLEIFIDEWQRSWPG